MSTGTMLTVAEVAEMLRVSRPWVRAHASGNRKPVLLSAKMGKQRRFRLEHVQQFLTECERKAADIVSTNERAR